MKMATPLKKARGYGSAHTGASHFIFQRATALALIPLTLWFGVAALGLIGASDVEASIFLSSPINAVLMGLFALAMFYHLVLGLQEVVIDYIPNQFLKFLLVFVAYAFAIVAAFFCLFALASIAV